MKNSEIKRLFILILLILSILAGGKYFFNYQNLYANLYNANNLIKLENNQNLTPGIYIVYPLDGSMCSGCLYNFSLRLKEYFRGEIFVLFPEKVSIKQNGEKVFKPVFYSSIHNFLINKIFFINNKGEIVFLCKLDYLMSGKRQNLKNIIYSFRWDIEK